MSLSISIFGMDTSTGEPGLPTLIDGPAGLAGVERTRTTLWGSQAVIALGTRFLPRLAHEDLWISNAELDDFAKECEMLLDHAQALGTATPWAEGYIVRCLRNFMAAAASARRVGGGIVID